MKKYKVETSNKVYICNGLDEMLNKVTAFKMAGIQYNLKAI